MKYTSLVLAIVFILYCKCATAQANNPVTRFDAVQISLNEADNRIEKISTYSAFRLPLASIAAFCKNGSGRIAMNLRMTNNLSFELALQPASILDLQYKLYVATDTGVRVINANPEFLYKGRTRNGGAVRLAIKNSFISGSILENGTEYVIESWKKYNQHAGDDDCILYESKDVVPVSLDCQAGLGEADGSQRGQGGTCSAARIYNMVDYSVYQHYGYSVEAVENFLLTNLNNVEGVYSNLNFDAADPADTGSDYVKFKVMATYISTCPTCDFVDSTNSTGSMSIQLRNGFFANLGLSPPFDFIPHIWTMRPINAGLRQLSGVTIGACIFMGHRTDDPLYLRLVAAHETGHYFGCDHDNDMKADITGFIMFSSAGTNATRFSRLSDFGGINYSSNLAIKEGVLKPLKFIVDCMPPPCEKVTGISVQYNSIRGPRISWTGNGRVALNYKLKDVAQFDTSTIQYSDSNAFVFDGLLPCQEYTIEIKKVCGPAIFGVADQVYLNSAFIQLSSLATGNRHAENYDLSCKVAGYSSFLRQAVITVDHIAYPFLFDSSTMTVSVNHLFADGARHRVDITDHNNQRYCSGPFFFKAPYYRDNSVLALAADFNDCQSPAGWKDTLLQLRPDLSNAYSVAYGQLTAYHAAFNQGTLDSSCMAFANFLGQSHGKLLYQSPGTDISQLSNKKLSFDYNFRSVQMFAGYYSDGSFSVEGFDGSGWRKLFLSNAKIVRKPLGRYISIWDSIPARQFISLDSFTNKDFRIRFIIDDAAYVDSNGVLNRSILMAAFDNVRIDGYVKNSSGQQDVFTLYPNPAKEDVFIRTSIAAGVGIQYRIIDLLGRQVAGGMLTGNKINLRQLMHGFYIVQFFTDDKKMYAAKLLRL